jgi:hypothetical protein
MVVTVSACGRNLQVEAAIATSLPALQAELQRELNMQGQAFEVFDVHGANLPTDEDLLMAVERQNTPLVATLTEGTIHYIENRREELSQMQWKVVRDSLNGIQEKIAQLGREMQGLNEEMNTHKKEVQAQTHRLEHQFQSDIEHAKETARQNFLQALERVDALSHFIHSERNVREASMQGVERQIQSIREILDQDKQTRRSEANAQASLAAQLQQEFLEEVRTRQALEDRHKFDVHRLNERIDVLPRLQAEPVHELGEEMKKQVMKFAQYYEEHNRQLMHVKANSENASFEGNMRFQKLEEKMLTAEERLASVISRQEPKFEEIWRKLEKMSKSFEEENGRRMLSGALDAGRLDAARLGPVSELEDAKQLGLSLGSARDDASDVMSVSRASQRGAQRSTSAEPPNFRQHMVPAPARQVSAISGHHLAASPATVTTLPASVQLATPRTTVMGASVMASPMPCQRPGEERHDAFTMPTVVPVNRGSLSPPRLGPLQPPNLAPHTAAALGHPGAGAHGHMSHPGVAMPSR